VAEENMGKTLVADSNGELTFKMFAGGVLGSERSDRTGPGRRRPDDPRQPRHRRPGGAGRERVQHAVRVPRPGAHAQGHRRRVGDEILDKITDSEFGLVALAWMDGGTRNLYTKKPVRSLEDLKGMKIRVQGNPLFIDTINAMGGNGIAMDTGEIFSALQTGVIDGAENNPPTLLEHNHFQNAKFYSLTGHLILPEPIVMSKITWNKLTPSNRHW
jgi:TRAP-type C4-dicarboxylate transport system substrate-binding protein